MKIIVANYKNWCAFCHNESNINVEIFYNLDQDNIVNTVSWGDVLGGEEQTEAGKDEYDSISKEDDKVIRICKNCIGLLWNSVAKVQSIICRNCRKGLPVRLFKSSSGRHEYKIEVDIIDPRHGHPFCSEQCYNEYIAGHP